MVTVSSILAWRIPWTEEGAWHHKKSDMIERLTLTFFTLHRGSQKGRVRDVT